MAIHLSTPTPLAAPSTNVSHHWTGSRRKHSLAVISFWPETHTYSQCFREALGNVNISSPLASGYPQPDLPMNTYLSPTSTLPPHTTASRSVRPSLGQSLSPHLQGMRPWDFKTSSSYPSPPDDALMSWEPSRLSPPEWMHPKSQ